MQKWIRNVLKLVFKLHVRHPRWGSSPGKLFHWPVRPANSFVFLLTLDSKTFANFPLDWSCILKTPWNLLWLGIRHIKFYRPTSHHISNWNWNTHREVDLFWLLETFMKSKMEAPYTILMNYVFFKKNEPVYTRTNHSIVFNWNMINARSRKDHLLTKESSGN